MMRSQAKKMVKQEKSVLPDIEDLLVCRKSLAKDDGKLQATLVEWYNGNRRLLPWRGDDIDKMEKKVREVSPYETWVSEIMLQQTRVETVIEYFKRWVEKFPTVKDLANADEDTVNSLWAGLGYYRRARNLHLGAKKVLEEFDGELPKDMKKLLSVPGIGEYTSGAIGSIAFNLPVPLVDGNVIRVFSRLCKVNRDHKDRDLIKSCWKFATEIVPEDSPGDFNQSLMELGATICTPQAPKCGTCPVQSYCSAYQNDRENVTKYPGKPEKKALPEEAYHVAVISRPRGEETEYLLKRRPEKGLLAGQWEFIVAPIELAATPAFSSSSSSGRTNKTKESPLMNIDLETRHMSFKNHVGKSGLELCDSCSSSGTRSNVGSFHHTFTHKRHYLHVEKIRVQQSGCDCIKTEENAVAWMTVPEMNDKGLTKAMKTCLEMSKTKTMDSFFNKKKRKQQQQPNVARKTNKKKGKK